MVHLCSMCFAMTVIQIIHQRCLLQQLVKEKSDSTQIYIHAEKSAYRWNMERFSELELGVQNYQHFCNYLFQLKVLTMSEDVYFNEPGFDGEQGTDKDEKEKLGL